MVRRQNEGSFGCEAVARALGQPNVPECAVGFHFLCLYAAKISLSFCRLFLFFYNERQRLIYETKLQHSYLLNLEHSYINFNFNLYYFHMSQ